MAYLKNVGTSDQSWESLKPELLVLGLFEDEKLSGFNLDVDDASGKAVSKCLSSGDFSGEQGKTRLLFPDGPAKRVMLVGLGKREEFSLDNLRQAAGTAVKTAQYNKWKSFVTEIPGMDALNESDEVVSQAFVEGLVLGSYKFLEYKTDKKDETILDSVSIINNPVMDGVERGRIVAEAVCFVRDLAFHPSNIMTPSRLASEAEKIASQFGMTCKVYERDEFTEMGLGAFASVARGTDEPPKFILLEYQGGEKGDKPIAFIGKGITFDTGGISIKPSKAMDEMKYDMCGAAAVLGIFKAVGELKPNVNIVGAIATTENMPGGHATKPGDIVTAYNGKTIEILNTDAEGRMILADAIAYADKYDPEGL
ncbi:MAG: leucyl aminopeptidase [Candidatus Marinimicrobia bacterium]|nr:leucyl aminopeptidase [Candidatus Neomarinimicrobiota bacterium]